jgi:hypothetical protein
MLAPQHTLAFPPQQPLFGRPSLQCSAVHALMCQRWVLAASEVLYARFALGLVWSQTGL